MTTTDDAVAPASPSNTPSHDSNAPSPDSNAPATDSNASAATSARAIGRQVVLAVVVAALLLVVIDVVVGSVAFQARQSQRIDDFAVPQPELVRGDASMVLQAPKIGLNQVVVEGATPALLRGGPGHVESTPLPGGEGNTVLLGRSTRFSGSFRHIGDLVAGDVLAVETRDGVAYRYKVTKVKTVDDDDLSPLDPEGAPRLTLVTSAGWMLDGRRTVVVAEADGVHPAPAIERAEEVQLDTPDAFDVRPAGALVLAVGGILVAALGVAGIVGLRHRYSTLTIVVVAGPVLALGVALMLLNADAFLPITY